MAIMRPLDPPATTAANTRTTRRPSTTVSAVKLSIPSEVASSALSAASQALRVCAEAIRVLNARVTFLEHALMVTHGLKQAPTSIRQALDMESSSHVDTATAARLMSVEERTLRRWAKQGSGPLMPLREKGRLKWSVHDIRLLVTRQ